MRVEIMATPEIINCSCNNCNSVLCISSNEWTEISSSYSTCVNLAYFSLPGLELVEPKRPGSKGSALEGCSVQLLRCTKCKTAMGIKCVDGPREKKANVNRSFLKLTKMTLKSIATSIIVKPNIKQRQRPASAASPMPSKAFKSLIETQSTPAATTMPSNTRLSTGSRPDPSSGESRDPFDVSSDSEEVEIIKPASDPKSEIESRSKTIDTKAQEESFNAVQEFESQRKDIDRILETLSNLQGDMNFIKGSISDLENKQPGTLVQPQIFAEEIDILTENVSKFSKGFSEVEGLKFDIKMMQQRVKRLEEDKLRNRVSVTATEHLQKPIRFSTPIPGVKASPQPTPRNRTGLFRENFLTSQDPHFRDTSRSDSEMPAGGHPLRNEFQFPNESDDMNGHYEPYEDSQPSDREAQIDTTRDDANGENYRIPRISTAEMPPPRAPYTPVDPRLSDTLQSIINNSLGSFPRAAVTADATQATNDPTFVTSDMSDSEQIVDVRPEPQYPSPPQHQIPAPQAQMVSDTNTRAHRRTSVPPSLTAPGSERLGKQGLLGDGTGISTENDRSKRRKTTALGETTSNSLSSPASVPSLEEFEARPSPSAIRNEKGFLMKKNGQIDGRSKRYPVDRKKRVHRPTGGPRDTEGYLLRSDGTRDARSVRFIDAAKRKQAGTETET
ncbi:hypothetical protein N7G274_009980 [Stereocaulon virgatum]|uniref:Uncharacterized protein n=1 Tax=Stereocaulon virgatum TaxID=373712 RepID=A0ABR3ZX42_9LECA